MKKSDFSFDELARQSPKGIVINYSLLLYKVVKSLWFLFFLIFSKKFTSIIENVIFGFSVLAVLLLVIAVLQYLNFKFQIKDNHFILHQGVIFKKKTSIPLDRIQNVNFKQNLIHQIINVTQVEIQTAGAKDVEVSIKAISKSKAEALKKELQGTGLNFNLELEEEIKPLTKVLFRLSFLDLLKVSLSENHIKSFFWIFAIVMSLFYQLEDYLLGTSMFYEITTFISENKNAWKGSLYTMLLMFLVLVVFSVVVSFVRVVLKHFDQRIVVVNNGIQISQGLFTNRDDVLGINKVQYITVVTNPIKKYLGIQRVKIKQAGSAKVKAKKQIDIVGVKDVFLDSLKNLFFSNKEKQGKNYKPAPYYLFRMFLFSFYTLLIINVVMFFVKPTIFTVIAVNVVLIAYIIWVNILTFKKAYLNIGDQQLIVGSGGISTVTTVMEYYKTQNVKLSESILQKRRGVVTLHLQTASGVVKVPCLRKEDAEVIMNTIIQIAANYNRNWI